MQCEISIMVVVINRHNLLETLILCYKSFIFDFIHVPKWDFGKELIFNDRAIRYLI